MENIYSPVESSLIVKIDNLNDYDLLEIYSLYKL